MKQKNNIENEINSFTTIAKQFLEWGDVDPFKGDMNDFLELLEKYKSPILNHLIASIVNWDVYDDVIDIIIESPYTNVSTLLELFWANSAIYWIEKEKQENKFNISEFEYEGYKRHILLKEMLEKANSKNAIFAYKTDFENRHLPSKEYEAYIPVIALKNIEGYEFDQKTFLGLK